MVILTKYKLQILLLWFYITYIKLGILKIKRYELLPLFRGRGEIMTINITGTVRQIALPVKMMLFLK